MDIDQLRGWASLMDKAMIASLVATILAVAALGITTFLSFRYGGAVRAHERAALGRYKGMEIRTAQLELDVSAAREKAATHLYEAVIARERAAAFEKAARDATEGLTPAPHDSADVANHARTPVIDAVAIRQRLAELGNLVRDAATRTPEPTPKLVAEKAAESALMNPESNAFEGAVAGFGAPQSPLVRSLRRFAGTKASLFLMDQEADAPAIGAILSADLSEAGWAPQTWTWGGVAGIFGVVVLVKDGSDPVTYEAASTLVESLRSAGVNATKGDWQAGWGRYRGTLNGPQTPSPTDAAIRIVIGSKERGAL